MLLSIYIYKKKKIKIVDCINYEIENVLIKKEM